MSLKSIFGGKSDQQSELEQAAIGSLKNSNRLSNTLANYSQDQYALTRPALNQAIGLYSKLAGGDRTAIQGTIAPQVGMINENYRGSEKYLEQQGIQGGARDYALADLNRQKTGQIATLPMLARSEATSQLAGIGERGAQTGIQGMGSAANAQASAAGAAGTLAHDQWLQSQANSNKWLGFGKGVAGLVMPSLLKTGAGTAGAGGASKWAKILPWLGGKGKNEGYVDANGMDPYGNYIGPGVWGSPDANPNHE